MQIKNHTLDSTSHLPLNTAEEPPLDSTLPEAFLTTVARNSQRPFLSYRCGLATAADEISDHIESISYQKSLVFIKKIVDQLTEIGVKSGDRVGIYAKNSPLWLMTDIAIQFKNCISVPIYDTLGVENIKYCLNLTSVKAVFVGAEYAGNIAGMASQLENLTEIVLLSPIRDVEAFTKQAAKVENYFSEGVMIVDDSKSMYTVNSKVSEKFEEEADQVEFQGLEKFYQLFMIGNGEFGGKEVYLRAIKMPNQKEIDEGTVIEVPEGQKYGDASCVIFTSGTSGYPKASVLSHSNVYAGGGTLGRQFIPYSISDKRQQSSMLSYLPLAHVFERAVEHTLAYRGFNIYYSSGNIKNLTTDLQLAKPTIFIGVPRVYQKIYDGILAKVRNSPIHVQMIFNLCYSIKKQFLSNPQFHRTGKLNMIDKIAFAKISAALGSNVEFIVSGSSSLPSNVYEFLQVCSCARVSNGYGMTEVSSSGLYNYCGQFMNDQNQLGFSAYLTESKIVECKECEFDFQKEKIGELCIKGPGVCMGYVDEHWGKLTNITDSDGFYHTGDLCRLNADCTASFIRRISLVVKLQHGEFVDLAALEQILEASPLVLAAFVHADSAKASPVAILSLDSTVCLEKFGTKSPEALSQLMQKEGDKLIRQAGMKGFNVPTAYKVFLDIDWTGDRELYTPSSKKQHQGFRKIFKEEIKDLLERCDKGSKHVEGSKVGIRKQVAAGMLVFVASVCYFLVSMKK